MMDPIWQATLEGYVKLLYDNDPQGPLLESIHDFEDRFCRLAEENSGNPDVAGILSKAGLQDEYNRLYMASINRNNNYSSISGEEQPQAFDYQKEQRLPTVKEFLNSYRLVYEEIRPNAREATNRAYEKLFEVEQRTDDLIEAQMIIEKEKLILNTVIADYKELAEDFLKAADPNYEITSSVVKLSAGAYATANTLDEITYMGEMARGKADDLAVQNLVKMELLIQLTTLIFAWAHTKRKIREGGPYVADYAQAMVVTREKTRSCYRFMSRDMGIDFDKIESTPFYRIMLLDPKGLDELWRIKKVMHPDNIKAAKYILFEEILTDRSMEDILLSPQKQPYYEPVDNIHDDPGLDDEYMAIAEELNRDIPYFRRNRTETKLREERKAAKKVFSSDDLMNNMNRLNKELSEGAGGTPAGNATNMAGSSAGGAASGLGAAADTVKNMTPDMKKEIGKSAAENAATSAVKEIGRGLLRGFLRK